MTNPFLNEERAIAESDWHEHIEAYGALAHHIRETLTAQGGIDDNIAAKQRARGLAMLGIPASNATHIAHKIRIIDDLYFLDQLRPGLARILINDLIAITGDAATENLRLFPPMIDQRRD